MSNRPPNKNSYCYVATKIKSISTHISDFVYPILMKKLSLVASMQSLAFYFARECTKNSLYKEGKI